MVEWYDGAFLSLSHTHTSGLQEINIFLVQTKFENILIFLVVVVAADSSLGHTKDAVHGNRSFVAW